MSVPEALLTSVVRVAAVNLARLLGYGVDETVAARVWQAYAELVPTLEARQRELETLAVADLEYLRAVGYRLLHSAEPKIPMADQQRLLLFLEAIPALARRCVHRNGGLLREPSDLQTVLPVRLPHFQPGTTAPTGSGWVLVRLLGVGAAGEVWLASRGRRTAALRFCTRPEIQGHLSQHGQRIEQVLRPLAHQGLAAIWRVYSASCPPCLVCEYVAGEPLMEWVHRWPRPDPGMPLRITQAIYQMACAVRAGHHLCPPVVHRNLRPWNVVVQPGRNGPIVRVLDIGCWEWELSSARPTSGELYVPPQVAVGTKPGPGDDVFALGVLWYQCLTGDFASGAPTGKVWCERLREGGMAEEWIDVLAACLKPEVSERPADAGVLAERLRRLLPAQPGTRLLFRVVVLLAMLLGCVGLGGWFLTQREAASQQTPEIIPESSQPLAQASEIINSIGMKLVWIAPGKFRMGSLREERLELLRHRGDEEPPPWLSGESPHQAELTRGFYLGVCEVTQEEYQRVTQRTPSYFAASGPGNASVRGLDTRRFPVESVTHAEAIAFCELLNALAPELAKHRKYRLPTEAEWEYACRANTTTIYHEGDSLSDADANMDGLQPFGNAPPRPGLGRTCPVGSYRPNAFGLVDMHGNVWEMCADWYERGAYTRGRRIDPTGPVHGTVRVTRGGGWISAGWLCRAAMRDWCHPQERQAYLGFRVAMSVGQDRAHRE